MTTSDGNAESLYMQGTGQEVVSGSPGVGRWEMASGAQAGPRTLLHVLLCTPPPPHAQTPIQWFLSTSRQGTTASRNKSDLTEGL